MSPRVTANLAEILCLLLYLLDLGSYIGLFVSVGVRRKPSRFSKEVGYQIKLCVLILGLNNSAIKVL